MALKMALMALIMALMIKNEKMRLLNVSKKTHILQ